MTRAGDDDDIDVIAPVKIEGVHDGRGEADRQAVSPFVFSNATTKNQTAINSNFGSEVTGGSPCRVVDAFIRGAEGGGHRRHGTAGLF